MRRREVVISTEGRRRRKAGLGAAQIGGGEGREVRGDEQEELGWEEGEEGWWHFENLRRVGGCVCLWEMLLGEGV